MSNNNKLIKNYLLNYYTKAEIGYRLTPEVNPDQFWAELVQARRQKGESLPFHDQEGRPFWYVLTPLLQETLHRIDSQGKGSLYHTVRGAMEAELMQEALVEEALFSSVIEGAFSTVARARELIVEGKRPRDMSDQMIANNARAMRYALEQRDAECSIELIHTFQQHVTEKTLEDPDGVGRFRDDFVYIYNARGEMVYRAPPADTVQPAMDALVTWTNQVAEGPFLHPVLRAIIIHTYFVYVHPYVDGNGRTARALLYWYLLKHGYEFFRYFSISSVIQETRAGYYASLRQMEDDDADMTYVLLYMTKAVEQAITVVVQRITSRFRRDVLFSSIQERGILLNDRQRRFLKRLAVSKAQTGTMAKYQHDFDCVYETARRDLAALEMYGILAKRKQGRQFVYLLNPAFLALPSKNR